MSAYRNTVGFGRRIEYKLMGDMLLEGLDVYIPLVDDHGVDCVVKRKDNTFLEVQIKARSKNVAPGDAALFAGIRHEPASNFYFVFCSERLNKMWILSSQEFLRESYLNKTGKNAGKRSIWFNGRKNGQEYAYPKFDKYLAADFSRFH